MADFWEHIAEALVVAGILLGVGAVVLLVAVKLFKENAMSAETDALKTSLDAANAAADALGPSLAGLRTQIDAVVATLSNLPPAPSSEDADALRAQLADMTTQVVALQGEADGLKTKILGFEDQITAMGAALPPATIPAPPATDPLPPADNIINSTAPVDQPVIER